MSTNVIDFSETLSITSLSGKTFPLTIAGQARYSESSIYTSSSYNVAGVRCTIEEVEGKTCVVFASMKVADAKPLLKYFPGLNAKARNCVAISPDTKLKISATKFALEAPHELDAEHLKLAIQAEKDAMPTRLVYIYSEYWPDYAPIEITSKISRVRHLTDREKRSKQFSPDMLDTILIETEQVVSHVIAGTLLDTIRARPQISANYWPVDEAEIATLRAAWQAWKDVSDAQKLAEKLAKEEKERLATEQHNAERKEAEENELMVWDAGVLYSSAGNKMLHSMGATFSEKDNTIRIYTTRYAREIPGANTTYSIRESLKSAGFSFEGASKEWQIAYSEENGKKVIGLLKQYDTKAWPGELGYARCWECGTYSKHLDSDGYCGC